MIPIKDLLLVVGLSLAATLLVGALGSAAVHLLRRRSVRWLIGGFSLVTGLSVIAAVWVVAQAMFSSSHDRDVVIVVIIASGLGGLVVALVLGAAISRGADQLAQSASTLSSDAYQSPSAPLPKELDAVAAEMASADARLRESRERERALEDSRRELVAWVSHDLRSPLSGVRAMAEALEDGVVTSPEDQARYYASIRREADRLAIMVDDLFELSRIHAKALRLAIAQVGPADLVSELLASADPIARAKGVRLEGSAAPGAAVAVDAREMSRALYNLIANAIRHTPSDGTVRITASVARDHAYFTVADACGGIPESDLPRVFDVAFRGVAARTPTADGGAGLGLAIARGIVEAHAGEINVHNSGPGCCFEVRIPLAGVVAAG